MVRQSTLKNNVSPALGLTGRLLISMPQLKDGPFAKAVVMICRHDQNHAMGVILNKPYKGVKARDAIDHLGLEPAVTAGAGPVYFGGPCDTTRVFVLHSADFSNEETVSVGRAFGLTSSRRALERLRGDQFYPHNSRLCVGNSGWSSGQLDDELRRNYWLDIPATHDLVFNTPPKDQWDKALTRLGVSQSHLWAHLGIMSNEAQVDSRTLN